MSLQLKDALEDILDVVTDPRGYEKAELKKLIKQHLAEAYELGWDDALDSLGDSCFLL